MPKVKQSLLNRLQTYINEFGSNIFSIDSCVLFCKVCEIKVDSDKKFNVSQNLKSDKNIKNLVRYEHQINRKQQQLLTSTTTRKSSFNKNLCDSCLKKIFRKAPSRLFLFKTEASNLTLPPEPILTRWASWINAAVYYCENFGIIGKTCYFHVR
jgi:hypothetical protein